MLLAKPKGMLSILYVQDVQAAGDHEHDDWKEKLVSEINHKLDLPGLNEEQEQVAIRFVVDKLFHEIPGVAAKR